MAANKTTKEATATNQIRGYEVVVQGQYYSVSANGQKPLKSYPKQTFYFPEVVTYREGNTFRTVKVEGKVVNTSEVIPKIKRGNISKGNLALHLIRRFHLEPKLREELDDFVAIRTCRRFSIKSVMIDQGDFLKKDINDLSEAELNQFVAIRNLNVFLSMYGDLADQKEAVKDAYKLKLEEMANKKDTVTEETNIYQAELDALDGNQDVDPLSGLM